MSKQCLYNVTRTVKEVYQVWASSPEDAKNKATIEGGPHTITVVKETAKKVKPEEKDTPNNQTK